MKLTLDIKDAENKAVVYSHTLNGVVMFYGVCNFYEVLYCPDAKQNSAWVKMTRELGTFVTLEILQVCETITEALRFRSSYMRKKGSPICNLTGGKISYSKKIRCVETGEIYENASTAARLTGIAQGNLSKHLNNHPGYKRLKGLTFERVI